MSSNGSNNGEESRIVSKKMCVLLSMTCDVFVENSNYLMFLIKEIAQIPSDQVPLGVKSISKELLDALSKFTSSSGPDNINLPKQVVASDSESVSSNKTPKKCESNALLNCSQTPSSYLGSENMKSLKQDAVSDLASVSSNASKTSTKLKNVPSLEGKQKHIYITAEFKKFLETVSLTSLQSLAYHYYYCRCCNIGIISKTKWKQHVMEKHHLRIIEEKKYKNIELFCKECNITLLGSKPLMYHYMKYHEIIHNKPNTNMMTEGKENNIKPKNEKIKSKVQNVKNTEEVVNASSQKKVKDYVKYPEENFGFSVDCSTDISGGAYSVDYSMSASQESHSVDYSMVTTEGAYPVDYSTDISQDAYPVDYSTDISQDAYPVDYSTDISQGAYPVDYSTDISQGANNVDYSTVTTQGEHNVNYSIVTTQGIEECMIQSESQDYLPISFCKMLEEMDSSFRKTGVMFSGRLCTLCNIYFLSAFSWIDHIKSSDHINLAKDCDDSENFPCDKCKLIIFGKESEVVKLLALSEHIAIDKTFCG